MTVWAFRLQQQPAAKQKLEIEQSEDRSTNHITAPAANWKYLNGLDNIFIMNYNIVRTKSQMSSSTIYYSF